MALCPLQRHSFERREEGEDTGERGKKGGGGEERGERREREGREVEMEVRKREEDRAVRVEGGRERVIVLRGRKS